MLSEELYIMDKNLERLMVAELQEEVSEAIARRDNAVAAMNEAVAALDNVVAQRDDAVAQRDDAINERNIYKLRCQNKSAEEISNELQLSLEYVLSVLNN